jgi:hypothetical protein
MGLGRPKIRPIPSRVKKIKYQILYGENKSKAKWIHDDKVVWDDESIEDFLKNSAKEFWKELDDKIYTVVYQEEK